MKKISVVLAAIAVILIMIFPVNAANTQLQDNQMTGTTCKSEYKALISFVFFVDAGGRSYRSWAEVLDPFPPGMIEIELWKGDDKLGNGWVKTISGEYYSYPDYVGVHINRFIGIVRPSFQNPLDHYFFGLGIGVTPF